MGYLDSGLTGLNIKEIIDIRYAWKVEKIGIEPMMVSPNNH